MSEKGLLLGIDIGTTSIKVCIVDPVTKQAISRQSKDTQANVPSELGSEGNKQDVPKIISALHNCVSRLPKDQLRSIVYIGICGQMHGILLWKTCAWERPESSDRYEIIRDKVSHLYTWQDTRCTSEFLSSLPEPKSHLHVSSGQGCATLFWIKRFRPDKLDRFDQAGTIQDFVVSMLCGLSKPIMSVQNAASWGYFDTDEGAWNTDILGEADFPIDFLPTVVQSGESAGTLAQQWHGIPAGTPVGAGLGDLQCSVFASMDSHDCAVLNISTSAQIAFVMASDFKPERQPKIMPVDYFPYFGGKYLAVAASLNGGNALATFVRLLQQWTLELGFNVPQSKIWEKILTLAADDGAISSLHVIPTLFGERHVPEQNATVTNIDPGNTSLGQVTRALCHGVVENVHSMMPREMLINSDIHRIIGIGSALTRNKVLQQEVEHQYQLPVVIAPASDAALGAALVGVSKANH